MARHSKSSGGWSRFVHRAYRFYSILFIFPSPWRWASTAHHVPPQNSLSNVANQWELTLRGAWRPNKFYCFQRKNIYFCPYVCMYILLKAFDEFIFNFNVCTREPILRLWVTTSALKKIYITRSQVHFQTKLCSYLLCKNALAYYNALCKFKSRRIGFRSDGLWGEYCSYSKNCSSVLHS
jgi:hypothetical protein